MPLPQNADQLALSIGRFLIFVAIMALASRNCAGHEDSPNPQCAWIAASDEPVLTLAGAKVLAQSRARWLEREQIDLLLAERRLQEAFGAEGVSERIELGKVLKADVLVLARTGKHDKHAFVELVLAETQGGLRILSRQIPLTGDAEADAAKLCELVSLGLKKYGQTICEVYAVSPFLCQDLGYAHDHLRSAYARLFEELLLAQSGVLVVELKEAEAIAREYAIAAPEGKPARMLPTYVLGEFRHEGEGDSLQVKISIKAQRGEQLLDESSRVVPPASVPDLFREISARWQKARGQAIAEPNVAAEVRVLADRVEEVSRLGQWPDVSDLCEATLLLDPDQLDLRYPAIRALRLQLLGLPLDERRACEKRVALLSRALEHARIVVAAGIPDPDLLMQAYYARRHAFSSYRSLSRLHAWEGVSDEFVPLLTDLAIRDRQLRCQLASRYAELENWDAWRECILFAYDWKLPQLCNADRAATLLKYQDHLSAKTIEILCGPAGLSVENAQFFSTLAESPRANSTLRAVVQDLREYQQCHRRSFPDHPPHAEAKSSDSLPGPSNAADPTPLTFRPVHLRYPATASSGEGRELVPRFWQPLPGNIDVLAEPGARVLLLKQPGQLKPIVGVRYAPSRLTNPTFDGKYLWLTRDRTILVVDPVTEQVWSIDSDDGLPDLESDPQGSPLPMRQLRTAAISPGKALAVGYNGRTWYAMVHFNPQGKHKIDLLLEARESPDHRDSEGRCNAQSPQTAFVPEDILPLTAGNSHGNAPSALLVHRWGPCLHFRQYPAILDLETRNVRISPKPMRTYPEGHFIRRMESGKHELATCVAPDGALRTVLSDVASGHVVVHGDEVHIIGGEWWKGSLSGKSLQSCGTVPWNYTAPFHADSVRASRGKDALEIARAGYSNHYGLWVVLRDAMSRSRTLQVLFDGSGLPYEQAIAEPETEQPPPDKTERLPEVPACYRTPEKAEILWESGSSGCRDLVYTADGSHILTARQAPGQGLRLWEASTGRLVADLLEGEPAVVQIAVSHAGKYFATGTDDGSVVLWSASSWKPIRQLERLEGWIRSLAFSWDERQIAGLSRERGVCIWDVDTGRKLVQITDKRVQTQWVGFTPDNTRLITSFQDGIVYYWSSHDGTFLGSVASINWIGGFNADRRLLGVGSDLKHSLVVWDTTSDSFEQLPFQAPFVPLAVSQDGRRMVFKRRLDPQNKRGLEQHRVWVWDFPEGKEVYASSGYLGNKQFRLSPDGNVLWILGESRPPWRFELPTIEEPSKTGLPASLPQADPVSR